MRAELSGCQVQLACPCLVPYFALSINYLLYYSIGVLYVKFLANFEGIDMKYFGFFILLFIFLVSCVPSQSAIQTAIAETQQANPEGINRDLELYEEPPAEAVTLAHEELLTMLSAAARNLPKYSYNPNEFENQRSLSTPLNRGDELNGITEKWCLGITHIRYNEETGLYRELADVFLLTSKKGNWTVSVIFDRRENVEYEEGYDYKWNLCLLK